MTSGSPGTHAVGKARDPGSALLLLVHCGSVSDGTLAWERALPLDTFWAEFRCGRKRRRARRARNQTHPPAVFLEIPTGSAEPRQHTLQSTTRS